MSAGTFTAGDISLSGNGAINFGQGIRGDATGIVLAGASNYEAVGNDSNTKIRPFGDWAAMHFVNNNNTDAAVMIVEGRPGKTALCTNLAIHKQSNKNAFFNIEAKANGDGPVVLRSQRHIYLDTPSGATHIRVGDGKPYKRLVIDSNGFIKGV